MRLWLDVEDLFHYVIRNRRPSGIQRLSFEMYRALHELLGERVRFCRHDPVGGTLRTLPWEAVQKLFLHLLSPDSFERAQPYSAFTEQKMGSPSLRRAAARLPLGLRDPLTQAYAAQRQALSAQVAVLRHGVRAIAALPGIMTLSPNAATASLVSSWTRGEDMHQAAERGDVFATLGSPWFHPDYTSFVAKITKGRGIRSALLVYDLIPLLRPEWCNEGLARVFGTWFTSYVEHVDHVLAISKASALDVERWAARTCKQIPLPVRTLPVGTGFGASLLDDAAVLPPNLATGSYVLFVSTIEARKNHILAFRVWRNLLETMPQDEVPTLVFAGHIGWLVVDLMQQLSNCNYLGGKVVIVADPTDQELTALYRACRFTLFPSLYEGWGLPITESLAFGKVCIASDQPSMREAGGPFCLYIDPDNITGATKTIRRACADNALISQLETKIRTGFIPTPWRATAEALLRHLNIV